MNDISPTAILNAAGTLHKAGKAIGVSHQTIQNWVDKGEMPKPWPAYIRLALAAGELPELAEALQK
jgi:hypothetical protein